MERAAIIHCGPCPLCPKGKTYKFKIPTVTISFSGSSPLQGTEYELEKLRCNLCGEIFTAEALDNINGCRNYDSSAKAAIPIYKYGFGMPFNRIEYLQKMVGVQLSGSSLWEKTEEFADAIFPAHRGDLGDKYLDTYRNILKRRDMTLYCHRLAIELLMFLVDSQTTDIYINIT